MRGIIKNYVILRFNLNKKIRYIPNLTYKVLIRNENSVTIIILAQNRIRFHLGFEIHPDR